MATAATNGGELHQKRHHGHKPHMPKLHTVPVDWKYTTAREGVVTIVPATAGALMVHEPEVLAAFAAAASPPTATVSTNGWDTVFAIKLKDVNQMFIDKPETQPHEFTFTDAQRGNSSITGNFGSWYFTPGGSGSLMHLTLPITSGSYNSPMVNAPVDLTGAEVVLEVQLKYIPEVQPPPKSGTNVGLTKNISDTAPLVPITCSVPNLDSNDTINQAIIMGLVKAWVMANTDQITAIFAIVNINNELDQDKGLQWLKPTATGYAFIGMNNDDDSFLAVLNMTESRSAANLASQVDPYAIPPGSQSGFLISMTRYMAYSMLPALPVALTQDHPCSVDDFTLDFNTIRNKNQIQLNDIHYAGISYHCYADPGKIVINIEQGMIKTQVSTHTQLSPGIVVNTISTNYHKLVFDPATQNINAQAVDDLCSNSHSVDVDPAIEITAAVLALVGAIAGAIVGYVFEGIMAIVYGVCIAMVAGVFEMTVQLEKAITANEVGKDAIDITQFTQQATGTISWTGGKDFEPDQLYIYDSAFQMGGTAFPPAVAPS